MSGKSSRVVCKRFERVLTLCACGGWL